MHFPKSHSTCIGCLDSFSSFQSSIYHILLQCLWMYQPEPMDFKGLFYFALLPIMPFDFVLLYMVVKTSSDATYTYDALEWLSLINSSLDALHCCLLILYALQCSLFCFHFSMWLPEHCLICIMFSCMTHFSLLIPDALREKVTWASDMHLLAWYEVLEVHNRILKVALEWH